MGWILHDGATRPFVPEARVWVRFRGGSVCKGRVRDFTWQMTGKRWDITHYARDEGRRPHSPSGGFFAHEKMD